MTTTYANRGKALEERTFEAVKIYNADGVANYHRERGSRVFRDGAWHRAGKHGVDWQGGFGGRQHSFDDKETRELNWPLSDITAAQCKRLEEVGQSGGLAEVIIAFEAHLNYGDTFAIEYRHIDRLWKLDIAAYKDGLQSRHSVSIHFARAYGVLIADYRVAGVCDFLTRSKHPLQAESVAIAEAELARLTVIRAPRRSSVFDRLGTSRDPLEIMIKVAERQKRKRY